MSKLYYAIIKVTGDPKGAKRKRSMAFMRKNGKPGVRVYSDTKGTEYTWREQIALALSNYAPEQPIAGPIRISWIASFRRPKSHCGTGRNEGKLKPKAPRYWHTQKPDRDNLDKVVLDVLKDYGFFDKDDCQVCSGPQDKIWAAPKQQPGMTLIIQQMEDKP